MCTLLTKLYFNRFNAVLNYMYCICTYFAMLKNSRQKNTKKKKTPKVLSVAMIHITFYPACVQVACKNFMFNLLFILLFYFFRFIHLLAESLSYYYQQSHHTYTFRFIHFSSYLFYAILFCILWALSSALYTSL